MSSTSRSSRTSRSSKHSDNRYFEGSRKEICIDNLFPSESRSGTKGKKLDINTLFSNTPLNNEPNITFSSDILLDRIKKRREEKLICYKNMLKYCHQRIADADGDQGTDIVFTVVETVPECKDYNPRECLEFISVKLREDDLDTTILTDTTMFITWRYLELKRADRDNNGDSRVSTKKEENEGKHKEEERIETKHNDRLDLKDDIVPTEQKNEGKKIKEVILKRSEFSGLF